MTDRQHLASWSLDLDRARFAQALAALGALLAAGWRPAPGSGSRSAPAPSPAFAVAATISAALLAARREDGRIAWQAPGVSTPGGLPAAPVLADAWSALLGEASGNLRIAVRSRSRRWRTLLPWLQALREPAVGASSVFVADAFAGDGRIEWQLPLQLGVLPDDPLAEAFSRFQPAPPESSEPSRYRFGVAGRSRPRLEILVFSGSLRQTASRLLSRRSPSHAALVLLLGGLDADGDALEPLLRIVADELSAEGVVCVTPVRNSGGDGHHGEHWGIAAMRRLADELTHRRPLDCALAEVFGTTVTAFLGGDLLRLSRLSQAADAPASSRRSLPEQAAPAARPCQPGAEPGAAESRFIQHGFWRRHDGRLVEERQRLLLGVPVLLRLRIGPPDARWQSAPAPFPAHELPRQQRRHRLQVVFHEPAQLDRPLLGELLLPRSGPSSVAELVFTPRAGGDFAGRISVLHRGRVLQTVLIHTRVTEPGETVDAQQTISQSLEACVRRNWGELGSRRRFDASFILNHSHDQRPLLTGIAGKRAWAKDLSGIDEPIASINQLLSNVAHSVADYSGGLTEGDNLKLFIELARLGADLYSSLVIDNLQPLQREGMDVDQETHIQIVSTRADAVVPFEFIYQYQPPDDDPGVGFCPKALKALEDGACPAGCAGQQDARRHVCPMGFWGLRKVIERHVYNPAVEVHDQAEVIVQAEPAGDRVRLQLDQSALVAYSQEVPAAAVDPLLASLRSQLHGEVEVAANWEQWKQAVTGRQPTLLVAFPHNSGERQEIALELGGVAFKTLRLPPEYVHVEGAPYPLLLLLGCDTASTAQQYANHIRYFRQAGAAAIVSTVATVFGPHAVKVGEKLLQTLLAIQRQSTLDARSDAAPCLGEALREAKRQALRASLPMALCVVAFGDADWRL